MRVDERASVGDALDAWLLERLPAAEVAVQLAADPQLVLEASDSGGVLHAAGVGTRRHGLVSGAAVSVAVVAADAAGADALVPALRRWLRREQALELAGPGGTPARLAAALADGPDAVAERVMQQRLLAATDVVPPSGVPGRVRRAVRGDRDLLAGWLHDFETEAFGSALDDAEVWRGRVERAGPSLQVWEVGAEPVSLANARRTTPVSSRIGPVWTPLHLRGNGYASALTAAVTQRCLDAGDVRVVLLADVANPTSNALYERLGYVPVCDHALWGVRLA